MAHDVFVSHSAKDKTTADAVCAKLESHGIRCWIAPRDILPGHDWGGSIIKAINGARAMVLVFSKNANASPQIKREVERAVSKGVSVIPLRIENVLPSETLEFFISTPHWLDAFTPPLERHLEYLAEVVQKIIGGPEQPSPLPEDDAQEKAEAEAARVAEEKRAAAELTELKLAEEKRTAEAAEAARLAEEKRKLAEAAESARLAEERRKIEEEAKLEKRKAAEQAERARLADEKKKAAEAVEAEKRVAEQRKPAEKTPDWLPRAFRKIVGGFVSACIGWLAAFSCAAVFVLNSGAPKVRVRDANPEVWAGASSVALVSPDTMLFVGLLVWLLVLLPLYVFVPRTSKLWRVPICTAIGAVSGALITLGVLTAIGVYEYGILSASFLQAYAHTLNVEDLVLIGRIGAKGLCLVGAVFGGVTCWVGAATANYFHRARTVESKNDSAVETAATELSEERKAVKTAKPVDAEKAAEVQRTGALGKIETTDPTKKRATGISKIASAVSSQLIQHPLLFVITIVILLCLGGAAAWHFITVNAVNPLLTLQFDIGSDNQVFSVAFSRDGTRIATGGHQGVKVWDAQSGEELRTLERDSGWRCFFAFSPDGTRIVTGSEDKTTKVSDAQTGIELVKLGVNDDSVAFSPDGTRIVTGGGTRGIHVWDAQSGKELQLFAAEDIVTELAFSPDGRRIVTGGPYAIAKVWDARSGKELLTLGVTVDSVDFSPDGTRFVTGGRQAFTVWDAQSGKELVKLGVNDDSVAFSPDGTRIVTGGDTGIHVWDAQSGKELLTLKEHSEFHPVAFSPDGTRIVTGGPYTIAKVWDARSGKELLTLKGHSNYVTSVAFSPDGKRIVTGSKDGTAKVWSATIKE
jgi:WD40 repeat protein